MRASEAKLLGFLQKSPRFIIPIYQRTYSWTDKQSRQLWDDILRAGSNETIAVHFIGSIVYVEQGLSQITQREPLLVIDGQQRLTTVSLLIEALARALGDSEPLDGFSAADTRVALVSFDDAPEGFPRHELHDLREQRLAHIHASPQVVEAPEHRTPKFKSWTPLNRLKLLPPLDL